VLAFGEDSVNHQRVNMWPRPGSGAALRDLGTAPRGSVRGLEKWFGPLPRSSLMRRRGIELLVRRYLGAFGPAPVATSPTGPECTEAAPAGDREDEAAPPSRTGPGQELLDLPRAPLPDPRRPLRFASSAPGTRCSSPTAADGRPARGASAEGLSTPGPPNRSRRSLSMGGSREAGASRRARSGPSRSGASMPRAKKELRAEADRLRSCTPRGGDRPARIRPPTRLRRDLLAFPLLSAQAATSLPQSRLPELEAVTVPVLVVQARTTGSAMPPPQEPARW